MTATNGSPPPSPSALRQYAQDILNGREGDWAITHLMESNRFLKSQVEALLLEPFVQADYEAEVAAKAAADASKRLWRTLLATCRSYRSTRIVRAKLHRNRLPMLLRLQRNEAEKQNKWDKFLVSVREYRTLVCLDWIDRRKASWQSEVVWTAPNPFEPIDAFPYGSQCVIPEPVMDINWVMLEAPNPATVTSVVKTPAYWKAVEIETQNRLYQLMAGIQPLKNITTTTTNEQGTRTSYSPDTDDTIIAEEPDASEEGTG